MCKLWISNLFFACVDPVSPGKKSDGGRGYDDVINVNSPLRYLPARVPLNGPPPRVVPASWSTTPDSVFYSSENNDICTVSGSGNVTMVSTGNCTITATAIKTGYKSATSSFTIAITLGIAPTGTFRVTSPLSYSPANVILGGPAPMLNPARWWPTPDSITYSSRNTSICTVAGNGSVTLLGAGDCVITAIATKAGYRSSTSSFTIAIASRIIPTGRLRAISPLSYSSARVNLGGSVPRVIPATWSITPDSVTYSSQSSGVCSVASDGSVTVISRGNCVITATATRAGYGSANSSFNIVVVGRVIGIRSSLSYSSTSAVLGGPAPSVTPATWSVAPDSVFYYSSNPAVCRVASDGTLTLVSAGSCVITVTASKAGYTSSTSSFSITITGGGTPLTMTVNNPLFYSSASVSLGGTPPTVIPATWSVTPDSVVYSSVNPAVCTVANNGGLTLRSVGNCTITATAIKAGYASASSSFNIAITSGGTPLTIMVNTALSYSSANVPLGGTPPAVIPATWSVTPDAVTYSSGNPTVCTVASNGSITLRSAGNCAITATATKAGYTDATSSFTITITGGGTLLTMTVAIPLSYSFSMAILGTIPPTVTPATWSVTPDTVTYSSGNPAICTVASDGSVTLRSIGTCSITATATKAGYTNATSSFSFFVVGSTTPFTSVWRVAAGNLQVQLHLKSSAIYNFTVDWGDGTPTGQVTSSVDPDAQHTYAAPGDYTISISGICTALDGNGSITGYRTQLREVTDLGNVGWTDLSYAFAQAQNLGNVSGGNTTAVTDMRGIFWNAPLATPDVSNWDVSIVTDMSYMFDGATSANPNVSNWDVSNVTNMSSMFRMATSATPNMSNWDVSNVTDMSFMFDGATLANPNVSNWNVSSVTNMRSMFQGATSAIPNVTNWDVSSVTDMTGMFNVATSANPNVSNWDVSRVTSMERMFESNTAATPDVRNWNVSRVANMTGMFNGATSANPNVSNWDVSSVTNMAGIFNDATSATPNVSNWNVSNVTNMGFMFSGATSANPNVSNWDVSRVVSMRAMFQRATSANPNVSNWNVSNVTNMEGMFLSATSANPDVSNWNVSSVASMRSMFRNATLANPNMSSWNFTTSPIGINVVNIIDNSGISIANYSSFLVNFASPLPTPLNGDNSLKVITSPSQYNSSATSARQALINDGWTIVDGGLSNLLTMTVTTPLSYSSNSVPLSGTPPTVTPATWSVTPDSVTYSSGNPAVCTVASNGSLTLVSIGSCIITATATKAGYTSATSSFTIAITGGGGTPFTSVWRVAAGNLQVQLHLKAGATYNFTVDWGDGTSTGQVTSSSDPDATHTYASAGDYTITISGICSALNGNGSITGYRTQLREVTDLGDVGWTDLSYAFYQAQNLGNVSGGNTSAVTDMSFMFSDATLATPDVRNWDVSNVTNMAAMFQLATSANPDVSNWDVSNVTVMQNMFAFTTSANPNVSNWDVGSVTNMHGMFGGATSANPNVSNWNVASVMNMNGMFEGATAAAPNTSTWNVSSVVNMWAMFKDATLANPDVSNWNVSSVANMRQMFQSATAAAPNTSTWNVSSVTNMEAMFNGATLANPDVSNWNVGSVTTMRNMFDGATSANPNVSNWDVSSVTDMAAMFQSATAATPNTSTWNVGSVTTMRNMFAGATSANPNVSNWNVSRVTDMQLMFSSATSANPNVNNWDVSSVTNMESMFAGATSANPNVVNWDVSSVTNMRLMFGGATSATPNVSNWDVSSVTDMAGIFENATSANPNVSTWSVGSVTTMRNMFAGATSANPNVSNWDVSSVTNMQSMFGRATVANPDVSNWDVSRVTNMGGMFESATSATLNTTSNWNVANVTTMENMFHNAASATPDVSNWDVSSVTNMRGMFDEAASANPNVSNWNVSSVTNMGHMFDEAASANPNVSNWDVSNVTDMRAMFAEATAANPNVSNWNVGKVTNMSFMFDNATSANPNVSNWDVSRVTDMTGMFQSATSATPDVRNWNVSNVTGMQNMFANATSANPDMSLWNFNTSATGINVVGMIGSSGISVANYSNFLINFASPLPTPLNGDNSLKVIDSPVQYVSTATSARQALINDGWTINDGGLSSLLAMTVTTPLSYSSNSVPLNGTPPTVTPATWSTTPDSVAYSSGNPAVCTVASNGSLTLVSTGSCVITATATKAGYIDATSSFTIAITGSNIPFTSVWRVAAGNLQVQLHLKAGATYDFTVDWGDGSPTGQVTSSSDPDATHTYASAGDYTITISGICSALDGNGSITGYRTQLIEVTDLGDVGWTDLSYAFVEAQNLGNVSGGNTSAVTNMEGMFWNATSATPDVSNWDVSSVTNMRGVFSYASSANPNVSNWDVSNVTDMSSIFQRAIVATPDVSNWDVSSVTDMGFMFNRAATANPDVSNWDVSNVRNMENMFQEVTAATPNVSNWNVSSVTNMAFMFNGATSANPNVSNWDVSSVTDMANMFQLATSANPDVSNWNVSSVTDMEHIFWGATSANPNVSNWDVSSVANMKGMFANATSATPDVSNWDVSSAINMRSMFENATAANPDVSNWDVSSVTTMWSMFESATSATPDVSNWDVSSVTDMRDMFERATLANPDVSNWDVGRVTDMALMFNRATSATPDVSNWDVSNVILMAGMFQLANSANPDVSNWNVSSVTDMQNMFWSNTLANPNVSNWDVSSVTNMQAMFADATAANPNVSNWDVSSVTTMRAMFENTSAANPDVSNWDVSSVTDMAGMFHNATAATPDVRNWDVSNVTDMSQMFEEASSANPDMSLWNFNTSATGINVVDIIIDSGISVANYSNFLINFASPLPIPLNGDNSLKVITSSAQYISTATSARQALINDGWTITDGGLSSLLAMTVTTHLSYSSNSVPLSGTPPTVTPATWSATPDAVAYSSGDVNICTVASNGSLTLVGAGNCVVTATATKAGYIDATSSFTIAITGASTPFTSVWRVAAGNLQVQLHLKTGANYDFTVDWGDGSPTGQVTSSSDVDATHTYASAGDYTITITGTCSALDGSGSITGYRTQLREITDLGDVGWTDLNNAFQGAQNLGNVSGGNTSAVTSMVMMFDGATSVTPNVSNWDVSSVTNMAAMFRNATSANPDVRNWNVSSVENMQGMFWGATSANPDVRNWDVSSVINMEYIFWNATSANPDVRNWNVSSVTNMKGVFGSTAIANPDVSNWDVSNVRNMEDMFRDAASATPNVSNWDVSSVTNMRLMFGGVSGTTIANPDVSNWDVSNVINMGGGCFKRPLWPLPM